MRRLARLAGGALVGTLILALYLVVLTRGEILR